MASNANGIATNDENDKSLVAVVRFGDFSAEFGGDLGGANTGIADPDPNDPGTPSSGGNTCARPAGAPASATAVCNDGTYSSSQNRSGSCSSHSGVKCWICPGLLCAAGMTALQDSSVVPNADLSSATSVEAFAASYANIESSVAPAVGQVEVYKVHHHASRYPKTRHGCP